jgi:hypothetical protein
MGVNRHEKMEMTLLTLPEARIAQEDRSIHSRTGYWVTHLARAMECEFEMR